MKGLLKGLIILVVIIALVAIAGAYLMQGPAAPTVSIVSPQDGATITGNNITVRVTSTNFSIPTEGQYHVFLNSNEQSGPGSTFTFENVTPGNYMIRAELRRPDNSELVPPVSQSIIVTLVGSNITNQTNITNITGIPNTTNVTNITNQSNQTNASEINTTNASSIDNMTNTSGY